MQIFVKSIKGNTIIINVVPKDTIFEIKQYLYLNFGFPKSSILIYKSIRLDDDKTIKYYDITDGTNLIMNSNLRGD
jgi:hypothetical protein